MNNTDLISRSALLELAHNHVGGTVDCNDIARFPAVDAVEVVRCMDCIFYTGHRYCNCLAEGMMDDDYCSYGKRKMDAEVEGC